MRSFPGFRGQRVLIWGVLLFVSGSCATGLSPKPDGQVPDDVEGTCETHEDCDDGNFCTTNICGDMGTCIRTHHTQACDDGDPCTTATFCLNGECKGKESCCADGLDNDGDGLVDCDDPDCAGLAVCNTDCPEVPEPAPVSERPMPGEAIPGRHETTGVNGFTDDYIFNQADALKVGVRREWGGSIVFFGINNGETGMNHTNTIDANDTGREVQVAFYDPDRMMQNCAHNASCVVSPTECPQSITYLGWNPVQGGNRCNNGSDVEWVDFSDGVLTISTNPLQWNPNWDRTDCSSDACHDPELAFRRSDVRIIQRMRFIGYHIVELDYTIVNLSNLVHAVTHHELPTVYSATGLGGPDLWRLMDSAGNQVSIDIPANDGFFHRVFESPGGWVSLQNETLEYGVALYNENRLTSYQGWQNRALPFNNFRALFPFAIPAYGTIRARSYLLIGGFSTITQDVAWLDAALPAFGALDWPEPDQVVSGGELTVSGWALDNKGVQTVYARIDDGEPVAVDYGNPRPDVCAAWPAYPGCDSVGYSGTVDIIGLSSCPHVLEIVAVDTDGNSRVIARRRFFVN